MLSESGGGWPNRGRAKIDTAPEDYTRRKAETRCEDESDRDRQQKRIGRRECGGGQAGEGAGRFRLFVLSMVMFAGLARQLQGDRLRPLTLSGVSANGTDLKL